MKKLVCGVSAFQEFVFRPMREFFEQLSGGQSPRALFIACSDSRVSVDLITQAEPGDLFVLRNAGNLVPPYGASTGGEGATIEYAVAQLGVRNIVVCGHSECGAMKALLTPGAIAELPAVTRWLQHAEATKLIVKDHVNRLSFPELVDQAARANVLVQLENLRSHPSVAAGIVKGELYLHGWFYKFISGEMFTYHPSKGEFISLTQSAPVTAVPPGIPIDSVPSRPGDPRGAWIVEGSQPRFDRAAAALSEYGKQAKALTATGRYSRDDQNG